MIDPKLVENWDIVFALAEKGCGYFAQYEAQVAVPRPCTGGADPFWFLSMPCPEGCTSSPPPQLPTNAPCDPNYSTVPDIVGCCEGNVYVECTGTCCLCGGVQCEPSETCCDDVCVDLQTDHDHCNSCTIACGVDQECCAGECKNIYEDSNNCDGCGIVCPEATPICCNGDCCTTDSCCFVDDILTCVIGNPNHCGTCNNVCENDETCCNSECLLTISFQTDEDNCGGCGITCEPSETCCSGSCIDVMGSDTSNCGACGRACEFGEICKDGLCKDPCALNECSWTWNNDAMGCCHTYTCFDHDPDTGDPQVGFVLTSDVSTNENCSTGDSACCNPPNPCIGSEYNIWSPDPCPMGCCKTYTCTENGRVLTSSVAAATAENCAQAPLGPCIDPDTQIPDPTMIGNVSKYFHPNPCPTPFHALSTDENENGTVSALAGSWTATATCPQGCNCPATAPVEDGTDGQVVSYECASCIPACAADQDCCDGECKNTLVDVENCGDCGVACEPDEVDPEVCCNGECCGSFSSERDNRCCIFGGEEVCSDVMSDPNHCGECGNFCGEDQVCCDGECADWCCFPACVEGQLCCDGTGTCRDVLADEANCGACDFVCGNDPGLNIQCCNGECKPLRTHDPLWNS